MGIPNKNGLSAPKLTQTKVCWQFGKLRETAPAMPWLLVALHAKEDPVPLPCDGDASIGQGHQTKTGSGGVQWLVGSVAEAKAQQLPGVPRSCGDFA